MIRNFQALTFFSKFASEKYKRELGQWEKTNVVGASVLEIFIYRNWEKFWASVAVPSLESAVISKGSDQVGENNWIKSQNWQCDF